MGQRSNNILIIEKKNLALERIDMWRSQLSYAEGRFTCELCGSVFFLKDK